MLEQSGTNDHAEDLTQYCPECDYDLFGLPEDRCPECGKPFDRSALPFRARTTTGWTPKPLDLAMFGVLFYMFALLVVPLIFMTSSALWVVVLFIFLLVGPPLAAVTLLWTFWNVIQKGNRQYVVQTILLTLVMLFIWGILLQSSLRAWQCGKVIRQQSYQQMQQQTTTPP